MGPMTTVFHMIGKFHPLLVHLPIGILIYAYLHLGFDLFLKKKKNAVQIDFALGVGALSAILTAITGYLLSQNGEYAGEVLDWHQWLGVLTAIGSVILFMLYRRMENKNRFYGLFSGLIILLIVTGHYGGTLTHGEGFLIPSLPAQPESGLIEDIPKALMFNAVVMPIVKHKCGSCHNPKKKKGDLLLTTVDGWITGGKSGSFVMPGDPDNSLMLTRIHLPLAEKKHMPPSGKLQLDEDEKTLINWWIASMSNFDQKVEDLHPPEHIVKFIQRKLDNTLRNIPALTKEEISALQDAGIPVQLMNKDLPWLTVTYNRGQDIGKKDLQKLLEYKQNIRQLRLSKTNLNDKMLTTIKEFTNLTFLDLSLNPITSKGVLQLQGMNGLEYLNLYGTEVDKQLLAEVTAFPALKDLYLWQTGIRDTDIATFDLPKGLNINLGQNLDVFGEVQLSPPTFENEEDIFRDSLTVTLSHVAKNAKIHYTLDGSTPTKESAFYTHRLLLHKTSQINAFASMEGWEDSQITTRSFLKSACLPVTCEIVPSPNEKYKADGYKTLINLVKGSDQFGDGKWLGFSAQDVTITLDLGEEKKIKAVSFGSLRDYRSYIFTPLGAAISTSLDGVIFEKLKAEEYSQITGPEDNKILNYIIDIPDTTVRYVKLEIISQKKNPDWHSDPGADCWLFLDEVVVE